MTGQTDRWASTFGNDYIARNTLTIEEMFARRKMFQETFDEIGAISTKTILEIGANEGNNISILHSMMQYFELPWARMYAVEPNLIAFDLLQKKQISICESYWCSWENFKFAPERTFDVVFTSGVLIHVRPDNRIAFMKKIVDATNKFVIAIEYFSPEDREIEYRGQKDLLWSTDFGKIYKEMGLKPISCKFYWRETTGLDNLTVWVFEK